jgi:membrane-bound ClpP family serine protease
MPPSVTLSPSSSPIAKWILAVGTLCLFVFGGGALAQERDENAPSKLQADAESKAPVDEKSVAAVKGEPAPPAVELGDGRLIRVRLPLVGNADKQVETAIRRARDRFAAKPAQGDRRPTLILEFSPARRDAGFGQGSDFSRAAALARFLTSREVASIKTVAYIPRTIKGHGVLVALACEEIVMHRDAEIGDASIDDTGPPSDVVLTSYREIATLRRPAYLPLVLGMVDKRIEVLKVETETGVEFVERSKIEELKQNRTIVSQDAIFPAGALVNLSGRDGREYGFVRLLASDSPELARGLALPPEAVIEDQSLVGDWRPVMFSIDAPITQRTVRQLQSTIGAEIKQRGVNWIGVRIDSTGGELADCLRLANALAAMRTNEVQTVAYVPAQATGGAALVALACDQLVMHPSARLGGDAPNIAPEAIAEVTESLRIELAQNTSRGWSLPAAMIDPALELFTYHNSQTGETRYLSEAEAASQPDKDNWRQGESIKTAGQTLQLTSERAHELGVAWQIVDGFDEFTQLYGFENPPREARPNWALEFIEALSSPAFAALLLVVAFIGIYIELHSPGIGAGAFVSAVAFLLYFWSNFLHGSATWLEVMLFVVGVLFLLLELFVLPGFGIFGLGGGVMILVSLVLASQTMFLPQTETQLIELRRSLIIVTSAALATVVAAIALRHYLPHAPIFRTLLLNPTPEEDLVDLDYRETVVDYTHLIGQQGVATTNLMPAGKADFNGQLVDVIAEGLPIDRGQAIVVTKARGSRVLVRVV